MSLSLRSLLAAGLVVALAACAAPAPAPTPDPAAEVELAPRVVADGRVLPARSAELRFLAPGTVAELLVAAGDLVTPGAPLARLDSQELEAAVEQARAVLDEAEAQLDLLREPADPEAVAAAQAALAQAQAQARQATGSVTPADLQAARAELDEARALLARLQAGPRAADLAEAQAGLAQAEATLQSRRDALSAAKSDAELRVTQAANALRDAQAAYSQLRWQNLELERQPGDLPRERVDAEAAALRAVENAEAALAQARIELENARQAERSGIAEAEAAMGQARARLDGLQAGADADALAAARARVSAAEAALVRLSGDARGGELDAAQAAVAQAQANLDQLLAPTRSPELAAAEARARAAKAALRQAEIALDHATLRAPFAGTVVELNLEPGEQPPADAPAVLLADLNSWRIETSDLTELDVVNVRPGDAATLTFDALPDLALEGVVTEVDTHGESFQGDVLYAVTVEPRSWDERLRWNMTATVTVE